MNYPVFNKGFFLKALPYTHPMRHTPCRGGLLKKEEYLTKTG
jgi:hypothetical protein